MNCFFCLDCWSCFGASDVGMKWTLVTALLLATARAQGFANLYAAGVASLTTEVSAALLEADQILAQLDRAAGARETQNGAAEKSNLIAPLSHSSAEQAATSLHAAPVSVIARSTTGPSFLLVDSAAPARCVDLFGARYPGFVFGGGRGGAAQWPCAAWSARASGDDFLQLVASVPSTLGVSASGHAGTELCLTVSGDTSVPWGVRASPCVTGSAAALQQWTALQFDGDAGRKFTLGAPDSPCAVQIKYAHSDLCLTAASACEMSAMGDSARLMPCKRTASTQHWKLVAGPGITPQCTTAITGTATRSHALVADAREVCKHQAQAEFSQVIAGGLKYAVPSTHHVYRTLAGPEAPAPCMFAAANGMRHGEKAHPGKDGSILVTSGGCVPWSEER